MVGAHRQNNRIYMSKKYGMLMLVMSYEECHLLVSKSGKVNHVKKL